MRVALYARVLRDLDDATAAGLVALKTETKMWREFTAVTNQLLDEEKH